MPIHNKEGRLQGLGGCDTFYAVRSYVVNGVQLCDIVNPDGAMMFFGCSVMNGQVVKVNAPSEPWVGQEIDETRHPLVVVMYRSLGRSPIILGVVDNPNIVFTGSPAEPSNVDDDTPTATSSLDDVAIVNDSSKVVLKSDEQGGDVIIDPKRGLKVQLGSDGIARISRGGEASDGPVLANPYSNRDAEIVNLLNKIVSFLTVNLKTVLYTGGTTPMPVFTGEALSPVTIEEVKSAVLALSAETGS